MPFCYAPWTNIDIDSQGDISPCCKFRYEPYNIKKENIITSDLKDYTNSEVLKDTKDDFLKGRWPEGCVRCRTEEENKIQSKRQMDYDRWQEYYDNYNIDTGGFLTASIAFGNTCNLKCITCGPGASSRWYKEYKLIYKKSTKKPNHFYKDNFISDLTESCPDLMHLDIPGGEPFLSGVEQQKELLDYYIKTGQAENISIHYITNGQEFPNSSWWNRWQHFKEIDLQVSVDGIRNRYEYIRFPGDWAVFVENIKNYLHAEKTVHNLRLSVSHTLSAYNVYYLDEFFTWCKQIGLPRPWVGKVHSPSHMRASVFPNQIRHQISNHLMNSKFDDVQTWSKYLHKTDDSDQFVEFMNKTKAHDEYRSLDFAKTFPELAELIANYSK